MLQKGKIFFVFSFLLLVNFSHAQGFVNIIIKNNLNNSNDKLKVTLSANLNTTHFDTTFKVFLNLNNEVKSITTENLIVLGGEVKEIRKLSKTSFVFVILPSQNSKKISVQVESDALEDLFGNKNENGSNEVIVRVLYPTSTIATPTQVTTPTQTSNSNIFTDLLNKVLGSTPNCTYTSTGQLITGQNLNTSGCAQNNFQTNSATANSQTQFYNCYGQQIPSTQQCPYDPYRAQQQTQVQQQQAAQTAYQNQLAAAQQARQFQDFGQILGNLLRSTSFGGGNNSSVPGNNFTQPGPQIQPAPAPKTADQLAAEKLEAEKNAKAEDDRKKAEAEKARLQTEENQKKLDICNADEACKQKAQKEIDDAKAKSDADAKKKSVEDNEKNLEIIKEVKFNAECSSSKKLFCMGGCKQIPLLGRMCGSQGQTYTDMVQGGGGEPFYLLIMKYNDQSYAVTVKTKKLDHIPKVGDCMVNGPQKAPQYYSTEYKFLGCTSDNSQNIGDGRLCNGTTKPEAYPNIQQAVYGYKDTNTVKFNSQACNK